MAKSLWTSALKVLFWALWAIWFGAFILPALPVVWIWERAQIWSEAWRLARRKILEA